MPSDLLVKITDANRSDLKIVSLKGELDETGLDLLRVELEGVLNDSDAKFLLFNLHDLEFINSKGIGYLVSVHTHLAKDGRRLVIADAQEAVMDVISLVGLTSIISYYNTAEEAVTSL